MSRIQIECDRCGERKTLPVRQNHQARQILENQGWVTNDVSSPHGNLKEDYCPECQNE